MPNRRYFFNQQHNQRVRCVWFCTGVLVASAIIYFCVNGISEVRTPMVMTVSLVMIFGAGVWLFGGLLPFLKIWRYISYWYTYRAVDEHDRKLSK